MIHAARRKGRRAAARERVRRMSDLTAGVNEAASAHVLAKLYRAGSYLSGRLLRRMEVHRQLNTAYSRENAFLAQSGTLILGFVQVAVLLVGGYMIIVSDGADLAPGALVAFYIVLNQLLGPIGQVSAASQSVAGASASVERAAALLQAPVEEDRAGRARDRAAARRASVRGRQLRVPGRQTGAEGGVADDQGRPDGRVRRAERSRQVEHLAAPAPPVRGDAREDHLGRPGSERRDRSIRCGSRSGWSSRIR